MILAFDTTMQACSAAVCDGAACLAWRHEKRQRGHAEALLPMIEAVRGDAGIAWADVDAIGVTVGPGTFTGVRIGLATARGLALVTAAAVVGISSLEAVAAEAAGSPLPGDLVVCVDARRGQVYVQRFTVSATGGLAAVDHPAALDPAAAAHRVTPGARVVGSGAGLVAAALAPAPAGATFDTTALQPDARTIAALVARRGRPAADAAHPVPLYLRPPDAKLPDPAA